MNPVATTTPRGLPARTGSLPVLFSSTHDVAHQKPLHFQIESAICHWKKRFKDSDSENFVWLYLALLLSCSRVRAFCAYAEFRRYHHPTRAARAGTPVRSGSVFVDERN